MWGSVHSVMLTLEEVAQLILDLTCKNMKSVELNLLPSALGTRLLLFEVKRADKRILVKVKTDTEQKAVLSVKVKRDGINRKVVDVGDLRNCICAQLVPNMRVFNVLMSILGDQLELLPFHRDDDDHDDHDDGPTKELVLKGAGGTSHIHMWMDEKDQINLSGGCLMEREKKTFVLDEVPLESDDEVFYFENPFLKEKAGSSPTLMPVTMEIMSYVLGSWSLHNLKEWEKPHHHVVGSNSNGHATRKMPQFGRDGVGG